MGLKVIGAGFGRTGTLSLKAALEELGFGPCYHMIELMENPRHAVLWDGTFDGRVADREHAIRVFERHIDDVKRRVPPEQLLVYKVADGWEPLCRFLGVEVPDTPFPHLNDAADFQRMFGGQRRRQMIATAGTAAGLFAGITLVGYWLRRSRR